MADTLDEDHAQAGLDLLRAVPGLTVYDGQVPQLTTPPYVMVYPEVSWPRDGTGNTITNLSVTVVAKWTCHSVGESAAAARAVQMLVRTGLLNQRPAISGRSCGFIKQDEVLAPEKDESTGRLVMDAVSTYSLTTFPG